MISQCCFNLCFLIITEFEHFFSYVQGLFFMSSLGKLSIQFFSPFFDCVFVLYPSLLKSSLFIRGILFVIYVAIFSSSMSDFFILFCFVLTYSVLIF